jgi:hypothetical protein
MPDPDDCLISLAVISKRQYLETQINKVSAHLLTLIERAEVANNMIVGESLTITCATCGNVITNLFGLRNCNECAMSVLTVINNI